MDKDFEKFKKYTKTYGEKHLTPSQHGLYECVYCGSGTHEKGTGALALGDTGFTCFSCGRYGDIFDLMEHFEHIVSKNDKLKRAEELFGSMNVEESPTEEDREFPIEAETTNYEEYFREKRNYISETDYWKQRGLSEATVKKFGLGYDDAWVHPNAKNREKISPTPRLIIPTSPTSYLARDTRPNATDFKKMKVGKVCIFNEQALFAPNNTLIVVEGEIDALSIIEVGGNAIALGSTTGAKRFLNCLETKKPKGKLVLAFDADTAGRNCTKTISDGLTKLGIPFETIESFLGYRDANEALCKDREGFSAMIKDIEKKVLEKEDEERNEYLASSNTKFLKEFLSRKEPPFCVPTGFSCLDDALGGGLYEGVYLVGGIPSLGKTTFAVQIADHIAENGNDILFFSLEMSRDELIAKSISRETICIAQDSDLGKNTREVMTYAFYPHNEKENAVFEKAVEKYSAYSDRIFVRHGVGFFSVNDISNAVKTHLRLTGRTPVVIVDYLQILSPGPEMMKWSEKQVMDYSIMEFKRISRDFKLPVLIASSLNRTSYKDKVDINSFKESGGIEYTSDCLLGLQYQNMEDLDVERAKNPREIEVIILKNRHGETGKSVKFNYYAAYNYIEESEERLF